MLNYRPKTVYTKFAVSRYKKEVEQLIKALEDGNTCGPTTLASITFEKNVRIAHRFQTRIHKGGLKKSF